MKAFVGLTVMYTDNIFLPSNHSPIVQLNSHDTYCNLNLLCQPGSYIFTSSIQLRIFPLIWLQPAPSTLIGVNYTELTSGHVSKIISTQSSYLWKMEHGRCGLFSII